MTAARPIAFVLLLLPLAAAQALPGDSEQPITVEADSLEIRDAENISIYDGNVRLVQGSMQITSERLVIHFNDANELLMMEMSGSPARFRQLDGQNREMLGEAMQILYKEAGSTLELSDSARFTHAGDSIESEHIRINTNDNSIQAGGAKPDQRVKMLIQPRQNTATTD